MEDENYSRRISTALTALLLLLSAGMISYFVASLYACSGGAAAN